MGTAHAGGKWFVKEKLRSAGLADNGFIASTDGARIKNWFCETVREGVAGGCVLEGGVAAQHFI